MDLPKRKQMRLQEYDYSQNGAYFLTLCTQNRRCILCDIEVIGIQPKIEFSQTGCCVEETIYYINEHNEYIVIDKYGIMPNHIHMIVLVSPAKEVGGTSRMPSPTMANAAIPKLVSSLKRFTNKRCGIEIWQRSYYDHIIRNEEDYRQICQYIDENPLKWQEDELYL